MRLGVTSTHLPISFAILLNLISRCSNGIVNKIGFMHSFNNEERTSGIEVKTHASLIPQDDALKIDTVASISR